jgi:hypothetical protein
MLLTKGRREASLITPHHAPLRREGLPMRRNLLLDLRRFRGLFKTENSARKGEHCHERTRPTHRSFAEKLSGWLEPPIRSIPSPESP